MAMTLTQVWGALLIFVFCPLLGALPLTGWIVRVAAGQRLEAMGTGNVGVSAAFYHGGTAAGVLSVLAEAGKGIGAVLLARYYFPAAPIWEIIALIALVIGRYWGAKGAGTTNVTWGFIVHDPITAGLLLLISFVGFTLLRERRQGRLLVLLLLPILTALRHSGEGGRVLAVACLSGLIAWIYQKMPDDLALPTHEGQVESQRMFQFFRGDRALLSLETPLPVEKAGQKAATLSQLKAWGYPVPRGYVLPPGDDPTALIAITQPSSQQPVVVRSSAIGEDSVAASAAGQYISILHVTNQDDLAAAITRCFAAYNAPRAVRYRRDRGLPDQGMAVLVQQQVQGVYSGVAFSRDPIARTGDAVVIEALPGAASQVVSGRQTPERYQVSVPPDDLPDDLSAPESWHLPEALSLTVEGEGQVPSRLLQQVAFLARHLEARCQQMPQDIEWTFDGEQLWLLQSRPITTLYPLWTRKIAAEVIPGVIRPLTWSINRPLTCGVWGEIFTLVLGARAQGLDFEETATLHYSQAYFNASLLGDIFLRMGLPPESLEFLTRGAAFTRPPLRATLRNLPGLLRLLRREMALVSDFQRDRAEAFDPLLQQLQSAPAPTLDTAALLQRIEQILVTLRRVTYYSILAPLSLAIRQAVFQVDDAALDARANPEVSAAETLRQLAKDTRGLLSQAELSHISNPSSLFAALSETEDGSTVLAQLDRFLQRYGYLSEVGTDIAIATWQENPRAVRSLFAQWVLSPPAEAEKAAATADAPPWKRQTVQNRLNLKGEVAEVYDRLQAELRWSFVALEAEGLKQGLFQAEGDIFYLTYAEVQALLGGQAQALPGNLSELIAARRRRYEQHQQLEAVPYLVYGNDPPDLSRYRAAPKTAVQTLRGIAASPGRVEGTIKVLKAFQQSVELQGDTILVVPYTDAAWAPLLTQAVGIIAEVGGRLSHGAIVAREYGIPAVMDMREATQRLHDGQQVRLDGSAGTVELL